MADLKFSPAFTRQLQKIHSHIEEDLARPCAAIETLESILNRISQLEQLPEIGSSLKTLYPKLSERFNATRLLICGRYAVIYDYEENLVSILQIYHTKQDYIKHLLTSGI